MLNRMEVAGHERLCLQHAHVAPPEADGYWEQEAGKGSGLEGGVGRVGKKTFYTSRCVFPVEGGCSASASFGDDENGVALFCYQHRAGSRQFFWSFFFLIFGENGVVPFWINIAKEGS